MTNMPYVLITLFVIISAGDVMYKQYIKDNTCFIVPNSIKKDMLLYISNNKLLVDICFYTIEEVKKNIFFDYDEKSIYSLMKQYNLKYSDALLIIKNMIYISDVNVNNEKYVDLKEKKDYLDQNKLLTYNSNFLSYLKSKNIVTTYSKTNFINDKILSLFDNITYLENKNDDLKTIYEFNFIEDEVEFVAYNIASLLDKGIDINKIKLVNVSDEYKGIINKIFAFYNLPINLKDKESLYDTNIIKDFLIMLKNSNTLEESLNSFKEKYDINNPKHLEFYNKIIEVLNKYYFLDDYSSNIELIINGFKNSFVKQEKLANCIDCINMEEVLNQDNYYFLIGFNNKFPSFYKDEDYLSDELKLSIGFSSSNLINKNIKKYYTNKINNIKNITITYKLKDYFNSYLVSSLKDEINANLIKNPIINNTISYSIKFDKIKLSKSLDDFYKYSYKSSNLNALYNTYNKGNYDTYDNKFKGIDKKEFLKLNDDKISLSYSSLNNFYQCHFKYYLDNILKENEDTFQTYIGKLYHHVLSKIYNDDFDLEKEYNEYLKKRNISSKEEVLLIKLKQKLIKDVEILKNLIDRSDFKTTKKECEHYIEINIDEDPNLVLKGVIDKISVYIDEKENKKYAYVTDYKTGKPKINFKHLNEGLDMQLAIYMYLMNNSSTYKDYFLVGCYLQKILDDDLTKEELKLEGYTYNDLNTINKMDKNYFDKSFIKGVKLKKDGTLSASDKLFNEEYYNEIITTVDQKIHEAINTIKESDFKINPKIVGGKNVSCTFCKYKDICYKKYKDIVVISQEEGEEDE